MKLNTRTFLRGTCFGEPKNKDFPSKSKMILLQPNENWNDFKTSTLKCLSCTAKTQIGTPLKIYGTTAAHRCSTSNLSKLQLNSKNAQEKTRYQADADELTKRLTFVRHYILGHVIQIRTHICTKMSQKEVNSHLYSIFNNFQSPNLWSQPTKFNRIRAIEL